MADIYTLVGYNGWIEMGGGVLVEFVDTMGKGREGLGQG
jgi:hypothetical protein